MPWIDPNAPAHQRPRKGTFTDRTVALICPAEHTATLEQAELIKPYDLVVRVNDAFPMPPDVARCTTDRTDVLYIRRKCKPHKGWRSVKEIRLEPRALWQEDSIHRDYYGYRHCTTLIHPTIERELYEELGGNPNLGFLAIADILSEGPARLYVTGMSFYRTGYFPGHKPFSPELKKEILEAKGELHGHSAAKQIDYWKKNWLGRVEVDSVLERILSA